MTMCGTDTVTWRGVAWRGLMLFVYPVGIPLFRFLHHDALQVAQWRGKKRELKRKSDCCAWRAFDKRTWWFELVDSNAQIGGDLDARLVLSVRSAVAVWNVVVTIAHIDAHHSLSLCEEVGCFCLG
jgi:hypothetical protein